MILSFVINVPFPFPFPHRPEALVGAAGFGFDRALVDRAGVAVDDFVPRRMHAGERKRRNGRERGLIFRQLDELFLIGEEKPQLSAVEDHHRRAARGRFLEAHFGPRHVDFAVGTS
ncbi:MAG: hypothetical protein LC689_11780 [Myxococcales bacterium]|nr:hypothetical protein [Myxococcales bacterium]